MLFADYSHLYYCHTCTKNKVSSALLSDSINVVTEAAANCSCKVLCVCLLHRQSPFWKTRHLHVQGYKGRIPVSQKGQTEGVFQCKVIWEQPFLHKTCMRRIRYLRKNVVQSEQCLSASACVCMCLNVRGMGECPFQSLRCPLWCGDTGLMSWSI